MQLSPVPVQAAPGFTLTDQADHTVSLAGLRGLVVVLEFMEPRCSDICPIVSPAHYTVQQCMEDWLDSLTVQSPATLTNYRNAAGHMIELIGSIKLGDLKARDVQLALARLAQRKSTRSVRMYRMVLARAIRHAQVNDLAMPLRLPKPLQLLEKLR